MVVGLKLEQFIADEPDVEEPFRSLVGHLMWLANQTRPDILDAERAVARYSHSPKRLHWQAAMHVLMYVRFTSCFGTTFQRAWEGETAWNFLSIRTSPTSNRPAICFWCGGDVCRCSCDVSM